VTRQVRRQHRAERDRCTIHRQLPSTRQLRDSVDRKTRPHPRQSSLPHSILTRITSSFFFYYIVRCDSSSHAPLCFLPRPSKLSAFNFFFNAPSRCCDAIAIYPALFSKIIVPIVAVGGNALDRALPLALKNSLRAFLGHALHFLWLVYFNFCPSVLCSILPSSPFSLVSWYVRIIPI